MEALDWGALIIICIAGALSPGPSLLVIISITTRYGRLAGILGATGHGLAIFVYALTTALGVSWLSSSANQLFFYVQISGALLLLWMGLSMLISALISTLNSASKTSPVSENTYPPQPLFTSLVMATTASLIDMAAYCMAALVANTLLVKYLFLNYTHFRDCIFGLLLLILALSVIHNSFGTIFETFFYF
jgi:threonine/homoserine/homoserine lactone efflux protein